MAKIFCPTCHTAATRVSLLRGYKYYCGRCRWNAGIVRAALQSTIKTSYGLVAFGAAISVLAFFRSPPGSRSMSVAIAAAFCGYPTFWIVSARRHLRGLRNAEETSSAEHAIPVTPTSGPVQVSSLPAPLFEQRDWSTLAALPPPRMLKLSWRGRFYTLIALAGGPFCLYLVATWIREILRRGGSAASDVWGLAIAAAVICFCLFTFIRNRLRERRLLTDGAVANGYVVSQKTNRYTQSIAYRFQDAAGRTFTARCMDPSRSLYEGMTTPIFYDVNQPTQNIPLDCCLTKIVTQ